MNDSTKQIIRHLHGISTMQEIAEKAVSYKTQPKDYSEGSQK